MRSVIWTVASDKLWEVIQNLPEYHGTTTLIVTSDHGRGATINDWHSHGKDVAGADQIWLAIFGPDTPAVGEARNVPEILQRDVAPTMLDLMGVDYHEYAGALGKPIAMALPKSGEAH